MTGQRLVGEPSFGGPLEPLLAADGFRRLLLWSAGAHVALALVLTYARSPAPSPRLPMPVEVQVVAQPAKRRAARPPKQIVNEPIVIPKQEPPAPKPKPEPEPMAKPRPAPEPKPAKPEPAPVPAPSLAEIMASLREENATQEPLTQTAEPVPRTGRADPLLAAYRKRVTVLLQSNWVGAAAYRDRVSLVARFDVRLDSSGVVKEVARSVSSGDRYYDESAERAIWKAQPFPRPPRGSLTLDVSFSPRGVF